MRVLFLSLLGFNSFDERNIYTDLLREFMAHGHDIYCISPAEKRTGIKTHLRENGHLLKVRIGNTQKTNIIEKGISTLMIERHFIAAIKKYFAHIKFDLILYTTPPITFASVVRYVKKRDGAKTYLMLKDIFPQNALDLGMMKTTGLKGMLYRYFRSEEKKLYALSDRIGCMSQANIAYLLRENREISPDRVEICPNSIEPVDFVISQKEKILMRDKYQIPQNKKVFVYGGNLGRPQGISFAISCLKACAALEDVYFVIVGDGTDRHYLESYLREEKPDHVRLFDQLPVSEYEKMIACCDVGVIFLDHRFTIPNFPSRVLAYMQAGLPVLTCTDPNTDIGSMAEKMKMGWQCESNDVEGFVKLVKEIAGMDISEQKTNSWNYLRDAFSVQNVYKKCFAPLLDGSGHES